MDHAPSLPAHRVYLQRSLSEPAFAEDGTSLLFAASGDGKTSIDRVLLATGLRETLCIEPSPCGGVGYGGGLFCLRGDRLVVPTREGWLACVDLRGGRVVQLGPAIDGVGAPVTSECGRWGVHVAEHAGEGFIALGSTDGRQWPVRLEGSLGFAGDPCLGPRGAWCAWQTWSPRVMPWDESELRIARFARPLADCSALHEALPVSITSLARPGVHLAFPMAHPDGRRLLFTSDESGWRSPWELDLQTMKARQIADTGGEVGSPNWVQRMTPMGLGQGGRLLYVVSRLCGQARLLSVEVDTGAVRPIDSALSSIQGFTCLDGGGGGRDRIACVGSSPGTPPVLVSREVGPSVVGPEIVRATTEPGPWDPAALSPVEVISWRARDETEVWGIWTRARGRAAAPAIVMVHGGPTSASEVGYDATAQYFATRGWHVLSVNHRGSTQRGRAYQDMLNGHWGVVDVEDARSGAEALIERGATERGRIAILGGSAGGYTALRALTIDADFWAAGVVSYGIGELYEAMLGSHRFERHYQDTLIGPLPGAARLWRERSPLRDAREVKAPVLLFHGEQDRAVPSAQSVAFEQAVRSHGGHAELVLYADEGHGFRREANRRDYLQRALAFLEKHVRDRQGR